MPIDNKHLQLIAELEKRKSKLSDWEKNFLENIQTFGFLTIRQQTCLEKIATEQIDGMPGKRKGGVRFGKFSAVRCDSGWVVHYQKQGMGPGVGKREAELLCSWLNRAEKDVTRTLRGE